jgi:hypothetical protein
MRLLSLGAMALLVALVLSGCFLKLTGGGWMRSVNGVAKATFSVNYNVTRAQTGPGPCDFDLEEAHIRGTYFDRGEGVRFKFSDEGLDNISCTTDPTPGDPDNECVRFRTSYVSLDPKNSGTGTVIVTACDHDVSGDVDTLRIEVLSGPYDGYFNAGPVLGGNFKGHGPF